MGLCGYVFLKGIQTFFLHRPIGGGGVGGNPICTWASCMVHHNERLTVDGKLSVHKIVDIHTLLKDVFVNGMEWFVWKASAEILFPSLPDIAQRAINAKYSVQQGQDVFQVFLRALGAWNSGATKGKNDPSSFIVKDIWKGNPKCSVKDVKACVEIARKFGGSGTSMIEQLRPFFAAYKQPERTIATVSLEALAALKLAPGEMCPNFIASVFMTFAAAPQVNVIGVVDLKSIAINKNTPAVTLIDSITKSIIDIAIRMGVPQHITTKDIGEFRTATILRHFQKSKAFAKVSVEGMASECFTALLPHAKTKVENPWAAYIGVPIKPEIESKSRAQSKKEGPVVEQPQPLQAVEYKDGKVVGAHIAMIAKKGFTLNATIKHKKTGTITHELI